MQNSIKWKLITWSKDSSTKQKRNAKLNPATRAMNSPSILLSPVLHMLMSILKHKGTFTAINNLPVWPSDIPQVVLFFLSILFNKGLQQRSPHVAVRSLQLICRTNSLCICVMLVHMANNVEWAWPIYPKHRPVSWTSTCWWLLLQTQVKNAFGSPFQRAGFASSIPKVAPFKEKPTQKKKRW